MKINVNVVIKISKCALGIEKFQKDCNRCEYSKPCDIITQGFNKVYDKYKE